ncbi:MAG: PQQ-dependent sugar dehydrogenase [Cyclobacteriaceae bacterium]|nr:PQQ-dependent sugar dehydrogenase [Cyclobacteriaceae bacterium HetDA_MAG_MS6]
MKKYCLLSFLILISTGMFGQSDREDIITVLNHFLEGTTYHYPEKIKEAFLPGVSMFLHNTADTLWQVTPETYASWFERGERGKKNTREGKIVSIDLVGNVAYSKLQVDIAAFGNRYYDLVLLKKVEGQWKIVSKCTSAEPIPKTPKEMRARPMKATILEGLNRPWSMAFISEDEVIISEKDGNLLRVNLKTKSREVINGLPTDVARKILIDSSKFERGVLPASAHGQERSFNAGWFQVLLDPDFDDNAFIYVSYAAENEERASTTKVIRGKLEGNQLQEVETLFLANPYSHGLFHYGGGMIFGSDGKLYITIGERNLFERLNPIPPLSQDKTDKRGKVIRLNPDGSIPEDNPDFGTGAIKGLYAMGIRAAQGLAIDPKTGKIWFSEHGTIQGDELNMLRAGVNYGWPYRTSGRYRSDDYDPQEPSGMVFEDPVYFWDKTVAPTGLTFYSGRDFPHWEGDLIVPGLSKGSLWRMEIVNNQVVGAHELFINDRVRLRKAVVSPRGKLYLLTDEENGRLIQVVNGN